MTWVKEAIGAPMLRSVVQDQIEANTFANLGPFKALPCVSNLDWKKPVIIVGAGSSLKRDLAQLRKAKGYTIIAAAHAWRTLHKAGIHPHYIIHVDPQEYGLNFMEGLPVQNTRSILGMCVNPKVRELPWKSTHVYQSLNEQVSVNNPIRFGVHSGGSVTHDAFYIAATLGANPIILLGMDCVAGHVDGITDEPLTHLVPAKAGLLPTTAGLYQFWAWWCVLGRNRAQGQLWINASKGALFDGFEHVSLKQTLRRLK